MGVTAITEARRPADVVIDAMVDAIEFGYDPRVINVKCPACAEVGVITTYDASGDGVYESFVRSDERRFALAMLDGILADAGARTALRVLLIRKMQEQ